MFWASVSKKPTDWLWVVSLRVSVFVISNDCLPAVSVHVCVCVCVCVGVGVGVCVGVCVCYGGFPPTVKET